MSTDAMPFFFGDIIERQIQPTQYVTAKQVLVYKLKLVLKHDFFPHYKRKKELKLINPMTLS